MSDDTNTVCPCDEFIHPRPIENPAGLSSIAYRAGDYTSFREALLRGLPGEQQLATWQPAEGDLALQMLEWWAYLADILTFYNERIANDSYLRTAQRTDVVARIVALLGYRPRPPLAATGQLAALSSAKVPFTLPAGTAFQSKGTPTKPSQVFEADADTTILPSGVINGDPQVAPPTVLDPGGVLLGGAITGIKPDDKLLLLVADTPLSSLGQAFVELSVARRVGPSSFASIGPHFLGPTGQWMTVKSLTQQKDPRGKPNTQIAWADPGSTAIPSGTNATDCRVQRSNQEVKLLQRSASLKSRVASALDSGQIHLASLVPDIHPGDVIVVEVDGPEGGSFVLRVSGYAEITWYESFVASGPPLDTDPETPDPGKPPVAIPHSILSFVSSDPSVSLPHTIDQLTIHYGFKDVGRIIDTPVTSIPDATFTLVTSEPLPDSFAQGSKVLVEDANGQGALATVGTITAGAVVQGVPAGNLITVTRTDASIALATPVRLLHNLFPISRGKTVVNEVLGNGDATQAAQSFTLKKSPLTYFPGPAPGGTLPFHNTLIVRVDGEQWTEVENFVGQSPTAQVYVTSQNADGTTTVSFGDGIEGARLSTGTGNVLATYRYGAGTPTPDAASITSILTAVTGLSGVRSPVSPSGAVDGEPADQTKSAAPLSVLAFDRAISLDDYEALALEIGAARATAYYTWDIDRQQAVVKVYVSGDQNIVSAVQSVFATAVDPNIPYVVMPPIQIQVLLKVTVRTDPSRDAAPILAAVQSALLDPASALFGTRAAIGGAIYESEIAAVCMSVPGVQQVQGISFTALTPFHAKKPVPVHATTFSPAPTAKLFLGALVSLQLPTERHAPGEGGVFALTQGDLTVVPGGDENGLGH